MGCCNSKAAVGAVMDKAPAKLQSDTTVTRDESLTTDYSTRASRNAQAKTEPQQENFVNVNNAQTKRQGKYTVRPGYSSGASSTFADESIGYRSRADCVEHFASSTQTDILGLSTLRQEMVADGELTKTVVRIEPPCGQPIEEVYDGVSDGLVLGSGVSGSVRLVTHKATQVKYAVKILELCQIQSTEGLKQLRDEIHIMCQLDHPNIVRIEEVYEWHDKIYIVQELCLGGDLFDRLDEQPDYHYTEYECAKLVKQMLSAVRYLHSKGIIHRDLKLENFLFSSPDPKSELRMIDFGLSKHFTSGQHHHEKVGTRYTVAPEIIQGDYNEKSDIWALGVITYLLLSGETPFGGLDGEHPLIVKRNIEKAQLSFEPADVWEGVSNDAIAFVQRLLNPDPSMRPTAKEAQRDNWIQVWGKKGSTMGTKLNPKTVGALMAFKEQSDMQKLLSKVLSFTLLPEQIVDLRSEFEKLDTEGRGEISFDAMSKLLLQHAEAGVFGSFGEQDIVALLEVIQDGRRDLKIAWHEFLAAALSLVKIDDRNLRLAFDRMDMQRKGFITLQDLRDMLGNCVDEGNLEKVWIDSLSEVESNLDRMFFADFERLIKGEPPIINTAQQDEISLSLHISEHSIQVITNTTDRSEQYMFANMFLGVGIVAVGVAMQGIGVWQ